MGLILGILVFAVTHLWLLKKLSKLEPFEYDTTNCRDVRAQLGMFAYMSDIEETRKKLNRKNSKF